MDDVRPESIDMDGNPSNEMEINPDSPVQTKIGAHECQQSDQKWPGLPRGVKFDPSDEDLMWHLLAEIGEAEPHPFIGEFITSLGEDDGFSYSSPHKLPGVKQDGSLSYFFHRSLKAYENKNRKGRKIKDNDSGTIRWQEIGKTKSVYVDGIHKGSKKIMVLFMSAADGEKPEKTNWMMHQYHVGTGKDVVGEHVLSKIFYQLKFTQGDSNVDGLCIDATEDVGMKVEPAVTPKLIGFEPRAQDSNTISMEVPSQEAKSRPILLPRTWSTFRVLLNSGSQTLPCSIPDPSTITHVMCVLP